jgi:hypothetical protein
MKNRVFASSLINGVIIVALSLVGVGCSDEVGGINVVSDIQSELSDFSVSEQSLSILLNKNKVTRDDNRYKRVASSYIERNALAQAIMMQGSGLVPEVLFEVKDARNNALIKSYLDDYVLRVIGDEAVLKYYNDNIDKYSKKKFKSAGILISTAGLSEQEVVDKYEVAVKIAEKARKENDFAILAKQYSDDKNTAAYGGDLGWISSEDGARKILVEALLALSVGGVSDPVQTERGFHVLKLLENPDIETRGLEEVKQEIEYQLKYDARTQEIKRLKIIAMNKVKEDMDRLGIE